jgi:photosystem II stability/assembly factor-like uncharacterized protein
MKTVTAIFVVTILFVLPFLTSCGGGGGGRADAPTVNALGGQEAMAVAISGWTIYAAMYPVVPEPVQVNLNITNPGTSSSYPLPPIVGGGVSVSYDLGSTWHTYTTANGLGSNYVISLAVSGSTAYAMTNGGLSISTNGGAFWTNVATPVNLPASSFTHVAASGANVYIAGPNNVAKSSDYGKTWSAVSIPGAPVGIGPQCIAVENSIVCIGTSYGLYVSNDGGSTWSLKTQSNGIDGRLIYTVTISGGTIYVGDQNSNLQNDGLAISTDGGSTWKNIGNTNGLKGTYVFGPLVLGIAASGRNIYVSTISGLWHSPDGGQTWSSYTGDSIFSAGAGEVAVSGDDICATAGTGFALSLNNGATWTNYDYDPSDTTPNIRRVQ